MAASDNVPILLKNRLHLVAPSMGPFTLGWERFLVVRQSAKFKPKLGGFEALAAFAVLPL
ncbi:MAG: hypothetical protein WAK36_15015 [Pseudolabrys sp.]